MRSAKARAHEADDELLQGSAYGQLEIARAGGLPPLVQLLDDDNTAQAHDHAVAALARGSARVRVVEVGRGPYEGRVPLRSPGSGAFAGNVLRYVWLAGFLREHKDLYDFVMHVVDGISVDR